MICFPIRYTANIVNVFLFLYTCSNFSTVRNTRHFVNGIIYQKLACTFVVVALEGPPRAAASKFGQSVRTTSEQQGFRFRERLGSKQESSRNARPYNTYATGINT